MNTWWPEVAVVFSLCWVMVCFALVLECFNGSKCSEWLPDRLMCPFPSVSLFSNQKKSTRGCFSDKEPSSSAWQYNQTIGNLDENFWRTLQCLDAKFDSLRQLSTCFNHFNIWNKHETSCWFLPSCIPRSHASAPSAFSAPVSAAAFSLLVGWFQGLSNEMVRQV